MLVLLFWTIAKGWIGYMPAISELQNPKNKYATEIYSADMQLLGTFYTATDNRITTRYDELSPYLVEALVATEDARFYDHSGIDGYALMRVLVVRGLLQRKNAGGGSTITQQLAKMLFHDPAQSKM